jgi:hypothetical protein
MEGAAARPDKALALSFAAAEGREFCACRPILSRAGCTTY